jgi:hypothetical protein
MSWIVLAFILICVLLFYFVLARGVRRRLDDLYRPIQFLLHKRKHNDFCIIKISYSKKFVQLKKYERDNGDCGIEFFFPRVKWSEKYYSAIEGICRRDNIEYYVYKDDPYFLNIEFLCIDFGTNPSRAFQVTKKILMEVFSVSEQTLLFTFFPATETDVKNRKNRDGPS